MTERQKQIFITLLSELLKIWQSIDIQAEKENKNSLLYGFLTRQLTSINLLLEQIQYNFYILDTIWSKITWTALKDEETQEKKFTIIGEIIDKYNMDKNEYLINSLIITTQWRWQTFSLQLLNFTVNVRTNFENFIDTVFNTIHPNKEQQNIEKLEKNIKKTFWQEIDIENPLIKKFIKDRCKEYPFTNKLALICRNVLNDTEINRLKNLYIQRNSLHWLWISQNDEIIYFKEREESNFITHIINILSLTTEYTIRIYEEYKNNYTLEDITWAKQREITWFEYKSIIERTTI